MKNFSVLVFFLLFCAQAFAWLPFFPPPPAPTLIMRRVDINGVDAEFGYLKVNTIDANYILYDVNLLQDVNIYGDLNVYGNIGVVGQTYASDFVNLHADPTAPLHAATKEYVDIAVSGIEFDYFLTDSTSDITDYNVMVDRETGEAASTLTSAALNAGNDQNIFSFATEPGKPEFTLLLASVYDLHTHLQKTGGLAKTVTVYWKLFERDSGGVEMELMKSEETPEITATLQRVFIHAATSDDQVIDGNRLVLKIYANVVGGGATVTVTIHMEGEFNCHLSVKPPATALGELFLNRDGTNWMNADLNVGGHDIYNVVDANITRLSALGNSYFDGNIYTGKEIVSTTANQIYRAGVGAGNAGHYFLPNTEGENTVYMQALQNITGTNWAGWQVAFSDTLNADQMIIDMGYGDITIQAYRESPSVDGNIFMWGNTQPGRTSGAASAVSKLGLPSKRWPQIWGADINTTNIGIEGDAFIDGNLVMHPLLGSTFRISQVDGNWLINAEVEDADDTGLILKVGVEELIKIGKAAGYFKGIAMHEGAMALAEDSTAIGYNCIATDDQGLCLGAEIGCSKQLGTCIGYNYSSSTANSFNVGYGGIDLRITSGLADFQDTNITTTGDVNLTNLEADKYFGDGSGMTGIPTQADANLLYVPYIGANEDANLGEYGFTVNDLNAMMVAATNYYGTWSGEHIAANYVTDTNFTGFSDFNLWYHSVFDLNNNYYQKQDINSQWYGKTDINAQWYGKVDINAQWFGIIDLNAAFVPYIDGVADVNMGAYGFTANDLNAMTLGLAGNAYILADLRVEGRAEIVNDLNITSGVNTGIGIPSDANKLCFPSNSCEMSIDYNGTHIVIGG